ncbi:MAG: AAA family ATPase [Candidatus Aminicenantes bacterium]|nr:AAA family ATPase [Candidatus Aminicenantes bacterium]
MKEEQRIKSIPYGKSDFGDFRKENLYYVDKTRFIRTIEEKGGFLFLIRPRRFGKSLFLATLEEYYDIYRKDRFDSLFEGTYIHRNPTEGKNSYLVLKFNFSRIEPGISMVEEAFLGNIKNTVGFFIKKYGTMLGIDIEKALNRFDSLKSASAVLDTLLYYCQEKEQKLYVIIDEYDNFANTILSTSGEQAFIDITHGEGFFRAFFNTLKAGTTGSGSSISRLFMTGVSPITLDDVTSGFNIATNISLDPDLNDMMGFTREEVVQMIEYYRENGKILHPTGELLGIMSRWYNHYRFSIDSDIEVFNTVHVLYFMQQYLVRNKIPTDMIDRNVRIDYDKLHHFVIIDRKGTPKTNGNFSILQEIIENGAIHSHIIKGFPIDEITHPDNFISLLYYFGLLTIRGMDEEENTILAIPNESIKCLYYDYFKKAYEETGIFNIELYKYSKLMDRMAFKGEWEPVVKYIADLMLASLGLRDLMKEEKAAQVFWNVYFGLSPLYIVHSEKELNQGFSDLALEPLLVQHPGIKYSYLIEIKYIKPVGAKKQGPPQKQIDQLKTEAEEQLLRYGMDEKFKKTIGPTTLKRLILIFCGNRMVHHEEVK